MSKPSADTRAAWMAFGALCGVALTIACFLAGGKLEKKSIDCDCVRWVQKGLPRCGPDCRCK